MTNACDIFKSLRQDYPPNFQKVSCMGSLEAFQEKTCMLEEKVTHENNCWEEIRNQDYEDDDHVMFPM